MAQTVQPTIKLVGTAGGTTKTVYISATKIEEDFSNPPVAEIEVPQPTAGNEMVTKFYNLLKTKNVFTIYGKIGYEVDSAAKGGVSPRNTWQCYCDLRDLAGATQLDTSSVSAGKGITMTFYTSATVTNMKFKYPRDTGTDKQFTGHIMKAKISHIPQDTVFASGNILYYNPDNETGKEPVTLDVIITILVGTPLG